MPELATEKTQVFSLNKVILKYANDGSLSLWLYLLVNSNRNSRKVKFLGKIQIESSPKVMAVALSSF